MGKTTSMKITWKHDSKDLSWPLSFEKKVEIFYERTLGWQLHIADIVSNGGKPLSLEGDLPEHRPVPHGGFAVLQICLSYFETIAQYQSARKQKPATLFKEGVHAVFPELTRRNRAIVEAFLGVLWQQARNGLYHVSMTRPGVELGQPGKDIAMAFNPSSNQLVINPHILPRALKKHLKSYRDQLLDAKNVELRRNFESMFNKENGL
jgi:hypothetical protein